jgi:hypothetical protein
MSKGNYPEAGHNCCQVESIKVNVRPGPAFDRFPEIATFLVVKSGWEAGMQDESFERFTTDA